MQALANGKQQALYSELGFKTQGILESRLSLSRNNVCGEPC